MGGFVYCIYKLFCSFRMTDLPVLSGSREEIHIQFHLIVYSLNCLQSYCCLFFRMLFSPMLILFMFIPSCRGRENQINLCFSMPELGKLFHKAIYIQAPCRQNLKWAIYLTLTPMFLSIIRVAGKHMTFLHKLRSLLNLYEGHGIATCLQGFLLEKGACYNSSPTF